MDISGVDYLGLDRVLRRGTGEILAEQEDALLIRDRVSGACFLACEDPEVGIPLLDRVLPRDCDLLMVSNDIIGFTAFERYSFAGKLECFQAAYYGEKPSDIAGLKFTTAEEPDLPMLLEHYHLISPEELEKVVCRRSILLGYEEDRLVGFIGEHLEGSMGLLHVFPEFRHRGYGAALQRRLIARTMEAGFIPFGQVAKDNHASMCLQKKLGMTVSDHRILWMWK